MRVFEPGVRLGSDYAGSGLGLSVVKEIAEAHGGRVRVRSAPGEGATFTLVLPLEQV
jgi:signal transduction histidine kinase